jgi:hypothetical protein
MEAPQTLTNLSGKFFVVTVGILEKAPTQGRRMTHHLGGTRTVTHEKSRAQRVVCRNHSVKAPAHLSRIKRPLDFDNFGDLGSFGRSGGLLQEQ